MSFLNDIAKRVDDLVLKYPRVMGEFRKKVQSFADHWDKHHKSSENVDGKCWNSDYTLWQRRRIEVIYAFGGGGFRLNPD